MANFVAGSRTGAISFASGHERASEQALGLALLGESLVKIDWLALSPFGFRNCGGLDSVRRAREALGFSAAQSPILNCRAAYKHCGRANRSAELLAVLQRYPVVTLETGIAKHSDWSDWKARVKLLKLSVDKR